jgi:predicted alpha/beta superfamily hydrolase
MSHPRFARHGGLLGLALCLGTSLAAQGPVALQIGFRDSLRSGILREERKLQVLLPEGYNAGSARYPVVYLLDGEDHFLHTAGILQFLAREGRIPPLILVAISNTDRTRDLTPPTSTDSTGQWGSAGGAQAFLRFMREELFPHVDSRFRTHPFRVLVGHSFGGLLAIEALETYPEMFAGYIAISPSLWWDGMSHSRRAASELRRRPDLKAWVYMTTGNEGGEMLSGAQRLAVAFDSAAPSGVKWRFVHMPEETHGSIPHRTTYDGLEFVFADMRITRERLETLIAEGLPGLDRHYRELSARYGYTLEAPEAFINQMGYIYLRSGRQAESIEVFRENTRRFPGSANTYDSLGDAYRAAGRLDDAIQAYGAAVRLGRLTGDPVVPFSARKLRDAEVQFAATTRRP